MSIDTYLIYLGVLAAFFATPPDTSQLLVISNSLRHGLRKSMMTVVGDLSANTVQMTLAAFGLTAVVAANADALWLVKWAGVAYLAWIGARLMLSKPQNREAVAAAGGRLFRRGFVTSSANPYAVVFFAALFPQFIHPTRPVMPQLLILGVTYLVVDGAILILWAWAATRTLGRIKRLSGVWMTRVSGALMIAAAVLLGLKDIAQEPAK
ncbi:Threonine/homoserine/homoserine lactone efflux protein [Roseovarius lutimaris]|uniref:Threonine/homoserine/homoserine lactone efflux protein n=1 Tax=Roseovarius lutimaris TaxID=1005928 RepID=A0A1I5FUE5_9RHOB|nr:LysE family translocator [Roseovarius lutimaris]SFO27226.1 Threonine/homoserine/homoserine lactone efflux protein [Roseovarius lutimaris]